MIEMWEEFMEHKKVLLTALLAASGLAAHAAYAQSSWTGTADYSQALAGTGSVGAFDTYDAAPGVVLLQSTGTTGSGSSMVSFFDGFYQSYISSHQLAGAIAPSAGLNSSYELTAVASFAESVTAAGAITVTGGNFSIYVDNVTNHNFGSDSGFTDGVSILSGNIISGTGVAVPDFSFGATDITFEVTSFNSAVYDPDTIMGGGGIFTLRLGNPADASLLGPITSVMGNSVDPGDLKYAADGYITLAVPEAQTYAMMLAGLGLVGFMARRRTRMAA